MKSQEMLKRKAEESLQRMKLVLNEQLNTILQEDNDKYIQLLSQLDNVSEPQALYIYHGLMSLVFKQRLQGPLYMYEVEGEISMKDTMMRILSNLKGVGSLYMDFNKFKVLGLWALDQPINNMDISYKEVEH